MDIGDALADLRAFIVSHAQPEQVVAGGRLVDELERAIDARVTELLEANNREVERRRAAEPRDCVLEALRDCRQMLADQIEADLDFCCPKLPDGSPDESEMDEESRPMIEATRALLAKVDAALSPRNGTS